MIILCIQLELLPVCHHLLVIELIEGSGHVLLVAIAPGPGPQLVLCYCYC